jgi:hypothetical protein
MVAISLWLDKARKNKRVILQLIGIYSTDIATK